MAAISTLLVVALVAERELVAEHLHAARLDVLRAEYLERQRIERNLHDGVQQRMLALLAHLKNAERLDGSVDVQQVLSTAEVEVRAAMEELRELARGAFPPLLTESGLAIAVTELGARRACRSRSSSCPTCASTSRPRRRRTSSSPRASRCAASRGRDGRNRRDHGLGRRRPRHGLRRRRRRRARVRGLGPARPERPGGIGWRDLEIDSRSGDGTRIAAVIPAVAHG